LEIVTVNFDATRIPNAFGAPVYHRTETASTMEDARILAEAGAPSGTAVYADFQSAGRGRVAGRIWEARKGESLLCTVLVREAPAPGFTLRVGLAVARTFDHFLAADPAARGGPPSGPTRIKWPNDVLVDGKKLAGILCESGGAECAVGGNAAGPLVFIGAGLNIGQRSFPPELERKATSLALAGPPRIPPIPEALALYLANLRDALADPDWQHAVSEKLLWRGERISFLAGDPERGETIEGVIEGIGPSGELLFRRDGGETERLWSGEIPYPEP
jgi:BirA family biotin operon repressor/biotin-[acetyl-CoA-carboxylase] ligase